MAKIINITDKFSKEKPAIQLGNKLYEVNDSMNVVLAFEELATESTKDSMTAALKLAIGEEAVEELDIGNMSVQNFRVLMIALLATMQGLDYDEAERRFPT